MDAIRKKFCESLKEWAENNWSKSDAEFSKLLAVSKQQWTNIKAGIRCGDEVWRRQTASKLGIPYERMIGLENHKQAEGPMEEEKIYELLDQLSEWKQKAFEAEREAKELYKRMAGIEEYEDIIRKMKAMRDELKKMEEEVEAAKKEQLHQNNQ